MNGQAVDWAGYLAWFHTERAGVAEAVLSRALAGDHTPYRWLARAVSAEAMAAAEEEALLQLMAKTPALAVPVAQAYAW